MDSAQLEEYRKRMQARYHSLPANAPPPPQPPQQLQPIAPRITPPQPANPRSNIDEDERLARELQAQEDARLSEETAQRLQNEARPPPPSK